MADLNVQPKKKTSILPWILLLLGLAALIWFLTRDRDANDVTPVSASDTSATTSSSMDGTVNPASGDWNSVDFNSPSVNYDEITNRDVNVRGNDSYGIYGIGETVLFDENKATLRSGAEANLKQIVASIGKRYNGGEVRVYGYTDAQGSAGANKDLAAQRAEAVKTWLQSNGIDAGKISVNAVGESQPVATNSTETGRQQNRRVEIVARGTGGANTTNQ